MERSLEEFGPLGPVFTFLSWLIAVLLVAVSGLALGEYVASTTWYRTLAPHRGIRTPLRDRSAGERRPGPVGCRTLTRAG